MIWLFVLIKAGIWDDQTMLTTGAAQSGAHCLVHPIADLKAKGETS